MLPGLLAADKMPEAEVSLRLAFYLVRERLTASDVFVAIDGAQVQVGKSSVFRIEDFLRQNEWTKAEDEARWQATYSHVEAEHRILVHSKSGEGDVVTTLKAGHTLRVESKKGPLERDKSSPEYPLMREALGQLLTVDRVGENDILAIAVPSSDKFNQLAQRWRTAPLIKRFGLQILTVDRDGNVNGLMV